MRKLAFLGLALSLLASCVTGCSKDEDEFIEDGVTKSGTIGNYAYVDLGLSVKWATYNVGATRPTGYGSYFAWGETEEKTSYMESNYKWCKTVHNRMLKYCLDTWSDAYDNKSVLEAEDDAATVNWGGSWRTPTFEEQKELLDGCTWEFVSDFNNRGVNGVVGTSKKNGNTIFLPASGYFERSNLTSLSDVGVYWSASLSSTLNVKLLGFFVKYNEIQDYLQFRETGAPVRAVSE
ncbi:MAG: hypothetical protein IK017_00025 [Paludibacteraceae bacterium]|nr:hypothetical protein [Paludibacteraceae bacterium]MBO7636159.1 hypothetical protein [Paludibacteraceae bacterium]MBR5971020.1 hypothetical protein [Paludibacteraceae bacterium]